MSEKRKADVRRLMHKVEYTIPEKNTKAITEIIGTVKYSDFENLAENIAEMRAKYLKKVIDVSKLEKTELNIKTFGDIRYLKLAFDESVEAFNQLKHALEQGYFEISDDNEESPDI